MNNGETDRGGKEEPQQVFNFREIRVQDIVPGMRLVGFESYDDLDDFSSILVQSYKNFLAVDHGQFPGRIHKRKMSAMLNRQLKGVSKGKLINFRVTMLKPGIQKFKSELVLGAPAYAYLIESDIVSDVEIFDGKIRCVCSIALAKQKHGLNHYPTPYVARIFEMITQSDVEIILKPKIESGKW